MSMEREANRGLVLALIMQAVWFFLAYGAVYADVFEGQRRVVAISVLAIAFAGLALTSDRRSARRFGGLRQRRILHKTISDDRPLPAGIDSVRWGSTLRRLMASSVPWRIRVQWLGFGLSLTLAQTITQGDWTVFDLAFVIVFGCGFGAIAGQVMVAPARTRVVSMRRLLRELDDRARQGVVA